MELIKCGTKAITNSGNIEAIITGINIRDERVSYELSYFNCGEYKSHWLSKTEFTVKDEYEIINVGFKQNNQ